MKTLVKQVGEKEFHVYRNNEHGELLAVFTDVIEAAKFVCFLHWGSL